MNLDEKLTQILSLVQRRDEINAELESVLGGDGPRPRTVRDKTDAAPRTRSAGRKCSICGKPGHNVTTCPKGKGLHPNNPRDDDNEKEKPRKKPLSVIQYQDVKEAVKHDMTSHEIAEEMSIELGEVNAAIRSRSYESYYDEYEENR